MLLIIYKMNSTPKPCLSSKGGWLKRGMINLIANREPGQCGSFLLYLGSKFAL
jgi:hypothetical protein